MRKFAGFLCLVVAGSMVSIFGSAGASTTTELHPQPRKISGASTEIRVASANARFDLWVKSFRKKALAKGISPTVYDRAFDGVEYNPKVIKKDRNQTEFTKQIWEYLDTATSDTRVRNGKIALGKYRKRLKQIEKKYGVDAKIVLAIWGLESAYGTRMGDIPIIESLSTLAYDGRRQKFFEGQLLAALTIIQDGDVAPKNMTGSWAGAMGHTQFIPTSYLSFAQDFKKDGKRDIWSKDPTDALASTAYYLAKNGWTKGQPWGLEVKLPPKFNYASSSARVTKSVPEWRALGVTKINGKPLPDYGKSSILLPAGSKGAAFIIFENFHVIETYNTADAYVIAVGHLGDRIMGAGEFKTGWPRGEKALSFKQKKKMQRLLARRGFKTDKVDGIVGPNTIAAIRGYQSSVGLTPDGYATTDLLKQLKKRN